MPNQSTPFPTSESIRQQQNDPAKRIHLDNDDDLRRWAEKLDATPEQIKEAVQAAGDHADDVEAHLKGVRSTSNSDKVAEEMRKAH